MSATDALEPAPAIHSELGTEEQGLKEAAAEAVIESESVDAPIASAAAAPVFSQTDREAVATRIRAEQSLPPALRDCLARVVATSAEAASDGTVRVPIDAAVQAVSEALPEFLNEGRGGAQRADHPGGEAFFHGNPAELSDAEAEEMARGQLARSGLLRGQRVRE